jgi:hypothetical protein
VRPEELLESSRGLPGVVVRDLGRDVVADVRLHLQRNNRNSVSISNATIRCWGRTYDTVEHPGADEAHGVSVDGGERALGERPGLIGVVRNEGVGVLEEGDSDKEVVHDEVGQDVCGGKQLSRVSTR